MSKSVEKRLAIQKAEDMTEQEKLERRIACEDYPPCEARYVSVKDYVTTLEAERDYWNATTAEQVAKNLKVPL